MIHLLLGISGFWIRNEQSDLLAFTSMFPTKSLPEVHTNSCWGAGWKDLWEDSLDVIISMDHFRILTWVLWIFPCKHCLNGSTMNVLHVLWKVHLPAHLGSGLSGNSENFSEQLSDWRWLKQSINLSFCNRSHFNLQITLYSNVVLNLYCHVFYFYWSIAKPNSLNSLRTFSHRRTGNGPFSWMYGHFFSGSALALSLWKVHLLFSFTEESFPWILNTRGQ